MKFVSYGGSYIGHRANNEDSLGRTVPRDPLVLEKKGRLYLVCDGMGGTKGGEVASQLAIETIMEQYYALQGAGDVCLRAAIREASKAIAARAEEDTTLADMGSTVIALVLVDGHGIYAHVGDSRAYRLRDGKLTRLTRDHLHILDELGVTEEEAETHPQKNILSRALGYLDASEPDCGLVSVIPGDRLLLCSDGLSDALTKEQIQAALESETPQEAVGMLLSTAEHNNAHDNATALSVFVHRDACGEEPTQRLALERRDFWKSPERI